MDSHIGTFKWGPLNELLAILDTGEAHAIALAIELNADLILLDERKATKIAHDRNLKQ